jgi:hypothetical protein
MLHSDVWGPYHIATIGGYRFFVTFIEDSGRVAFLFLMKTKDESFNYFKLVKSRLENLFSHGRVSTPMEAANTFRTK